MLIVDSAIRAARLLPLSQFGRYTGQACTQQQQGGRFRNRSRLLSGYASGQVSLLTGLDEQIGNRQ